MCGRISHRAEHEVQRSPGRGWSRLWTFFGRVPSAVRDARRVPMRRQLEIYDTKYDWSLNVEVPESSSMAILPAQLMGGGSSINGGTALRSTWADSEE